MIQFNGREITATGFTAETFQRALDRAAIEGLRAGRSATEGAVDVTSGQQVYQATRQSCTCTAARFHKPCKHVALTAFLLDGLGLDLDKGVASVRLRVNAVQGITGSGEAAKPTLTRRVRQRWTADRTWMRPYGVNV
jgi:hypothetical protein